MYVLGSKTHKGIYSKLGIQFSNESSNQIDEFQGAINKGFSIFETNEELIESLNYYPPLSGKYGEFSVPNSSSIFMQQRIGPVTKKRPYFSFQVFRA